MPLIFSCDKEEQSNGPNNKVRKVEALIELDGRGVTNEEEIAADRATSLQHNYHTNRPLKHVLISDDIEEDDPSLMETTALRRPSENSDSAVDNSTMSDNYLTMSGTIKRGKKKGQNIDVVLNMSREELEVLEAAMTHKCVRSKSLSCQSGAGLHIVLLSVLCAPLSFLLSTVYSFGIGTLTWYNIFTLFSEEKPVLYRIVISPLLILLYPFAIVLLSAGLGLYAAYQQLSWHWDLWLKEFIDFEKGFYGWLCNVLDVPDCSPYQVVILSGLHKDLTST